jgi:hypothetical protein
MPNDDSSYYNLGIEDDTNPYGWVRCMTSGLEMMAHISIPEGYTFCGIRINCRLIISINENSSDTDVQLDLMTSKVATLAILALEEKETRVNTPLAEVTAALSQPQSLKSDMSDDRQPYNIMSGSDEELPNYGNAVSHQFDDYSEYSD